MISESGIATREDAETVRRSGARGVLVGESFIKAKDIANLVAQMASVGRIGG